MTSQTKQKYNEPLWNVNSIKISLSNDKILPVKLVNYIANRSRINQWVVAKCK